MTATTDQSNATPPPLSPSSVSAPQVASTLAAPRWRVRLGAFTVALAILSGLATFLVLTGQTTIVPTHQVVVTALVANLVLVLFLSLLIAVELVRLWRARRRGDAGARLHGRVVGLFALVAAVPAIIVAIVASFTLDKGLDRWFSGRAKSMIQNSASIAYAYMREHSNVIRGDLLAMANDLERIRPLYDQDKKRFDEFVRAQMLLRALAGAYIIDDKYNIITKHTQKADDKFLVPPQFALDRAQKGEAVVLTPGPNDQADEVGALFKLKSYPNAYLYVVRRLDPQVVEQVRETAEQAIEYRTMEERRYGVQIAFGLMYVDIALILLFSAVWTALWFANRLVAPIRRLIGAAQLVSDGNLDVQVQVRQSEGDLANLSSTFNSMTHQLKSQRNELLQANTTLDTRRRFTEAVLAGVTAGVIGIDEDGKIELINRSAEAFLGVEGAEMIGRPLDEAMPELRDVVQTALHRGQKLHQGQIVLRRGEQERTVTVRVTSEGAAGDRAGHVVTLDDITELVTAQRTSAWADIARRIAHEIKNPLTPIQLSAERLKRKYGKVISEDKHIFDQCTDTIIRQVGDIGRMVDEFSSFARMPKAVMGDADVAQLAREAAFLIGVSHPDIKITVAAPEEGVASVCDRRLISQMITNLVKNASEGIAAAQYGDGETPWVEVRIEADEQFIAIIVTDNGCGLPKENRQRLLEPYMTTREKGTGLGLAIVRKILEDHGGKITLSDAPQVASGGHGAQVTAVFARYSGEGSDKQDAAIQGGKTSAHERVAG